MRRRRVPRLRLPDGEILTARALTALMSPDGETPDGRTADGQTAHVQTSGDDAGRRRAGRRRAGRRRSHSQRPAPRRRVRWLRRAARVERVWRWVGSGSAGRGSSGSAADQRVGIEIRVGLATLLGLDEHPAEIPGLGLLVAPDARLRVAQQARAEWRFAITTPEGTLLSEGHTRHRPTGIRRDGPPAGIVELHIPATLLTA